MKTQQVSTRYWVDPCEDHWQCIDLGDPRHPYGWSIACGTKAEMLDRARHEQKLQDCIAALQLTEVTR